MLIHINILNKNQVIEQKNSPNYTTVKNTKSKWEKREKIYKMATKSYGRK